MRNRPRNLSMQTQPLNAADFECLEDILLKHGDDNSVLNTCELDGFFTALVSSPAQVDIADWFPAIWGGQNPNWESTDEAKQFIELSVRHINTLARQLAEGSTEFAPGSKKPSITARP
jgi:Predicted metal-binding protein related to the C-terminal domain of SecA